ncbi:molybdenum cofactor guanylyltransferase [Sphingomonas sp. LaA6.9]|uniref:molybdenum cofactor guanylyltransferase n=1 Tax=Sphingomonas sp. LaA6.9 TaxID=2919914 RepID=UPI001F4F45CC|nr:molybdenum cofactor guanylyltransferase [Sphingomonas sp. LaA6.9]MCJ8159352.1 molybdenum cofactor guanylyltransferase [Sphingomonas sp. LaA6.9]
MKILGAIIAGGQSRRFGSDKAHAEIVGRKLLDHIADALAPQTDALIVCGRDWPDLTSIPDRPAPDQGPLGGLCAALRYAIENGFDAVLTAGCDTLPVPANLRTTLGSAPAVIEGQHIFGLWPTTLADALDHHLASQPDRSMRGWFAVSGTRQVWCDTAFHNLNTPEDFALCSGAQGLAP